MAVRRYSVTVGEHQYQVELRERDGVTEVLIGERAVRASLGPPDASGLRRFQIGERSRELLIRHGSNGTALAIDGVVVEVAVEDERAARLARFGGNASKQAGAETIKAPMPGLVVRVNVAPGQAVTRGESLVVLQAMKMENELGSPRDATVKLVAVAPGQAVEYGQPLVELE